MKDQSWLGVGLGGPAQVSAPSVSQQHPHFTVLPEQWLQMQVPATPPQGSGFDYLGWDPLGSCL